MYITPAGSSSKKKDKKDGNDMLNMRTLYTVIQRNVGVSDR